MRELLKKRLSNQKGLTLIELLAVIVIIAIIAAIAIPAIGNIIENSRYNSAKSDALNVIDAAKLYFTDEEEADSVTVEKLKEEKYLDDAGKFEDSTDSKVEKDGSALKLTGEVIYTGKKEKAKKVIFKGATIKDINKDKQKGSKPNDKTIPGSVSGSEAGK